jgi:hypothetical protein
MANICTQCGVSNRDEARFCGRCASPLAFNNYAQPDQQVHYRYEMPPQPGQWQPPLGAPYQSGNLAIAASGNVSKNGKRMAIAVACLTVLGLIPCLGWLNWFVLVTGGITKILCWVGVFTEGKNNPVAKNDAVIGLVIVAIALFVSLIRLVLGGGCL